MHPVEQDWQSLGAGQPVFPQPCGASELHLKISPGVIKGSLVPGNLLKDLIDAQGWPEGPMGGHGPIALTMPEPTSE
jgi:hypothetical protein